MQQRSRWEEGKSDGVVRSERVEKLMSLLLFDGACLLQRQDAFLTFSETLYFSQSSLFISFQPFLFSFCLHFLLFLSFRLGLIHWHDCMSEPLSRNVESKL